MAEVIEGKRVILLFRLVKERATKAATQLAYEISNTLNRERNTEEQETKTGMIKSVGASNESIEFEFLQSSAEVNEMLNYAYENNEEVEFWRVNLDKKGKTGKYDAYTGTGLLASYPLSAEVASNATISTTLNIQGVVGRIEATITSAQEATAQKYYDTVVGISEAPVVKTYEPKLSPGLGV